MVLKIKTDELFQARVSSVHSSFVNLGGDTTANPAAARTTPNSPSNEPLLPLSKPTAQTSHYTGTSNYTGDFVGDEVSGQLQEDIAVFDGRSTFPHQWLTSPTEIHESQSLSKAPWSNDGATEGGKLTLLSLAAKAAADNELEPRRGRAETLTFEECEERRKSSSFSNLPAELVSFKRQIPKKYAVNEKYYIETSGIRSDKYPIKSASLRGLKLFGHLISLLLLRSHFFLNVKNLNFIGAVFFATRSRIMMVITALKRSS